MTRWSALSGDTSGPDYAARFAALAATGKAVHGEAAFCAALMRAPARVLDAGCGTGRVAIRMAELGYECVGVDLDTSMLSVARAEAPAIPWFNADLATLDLDGDSFDLVVVAGNVVALVAPATLPATVLRLAAHLRVGGLLVSGFGLDAEHLPAGCPITPLSEYDRACAAAGLTLLARHSTWDGADFTDGQDGYAVSVHTATVAGRADPSLR
jgi:SAM-dependent methyltransferase